jgi:hypothetical protein
MANRRGSGVPIGEFNPQGASETSLPSVSYATGEQYSTLANVSKLLSDQVGAFGDELAKSEGKKAGAMAGTDPNFKPSDVPTLRGRAFDEEATNVYKSNLTAKFQSDAMDVFQANKSDPNAFNTAYDKLVQTYNQQHVFPEIKGAFDAQALTWKTSLRMKALNNFENDQKDQARATLINNSSAFDTNRARLLSIDPHSPETEKQINIGLTQQLADIRTQADAEAITEEHAAELTIAAKNRAASDIITARANSLQNAGDVEAYRTRIKRDFGAGKIPGLSDWETLDASLLKLGTQRKTQADQGLKQLNTKIDDFLDRSGKGLTPSSAEWLLLEQQGQGLGAAGTAAVDQARAKLRVRARIDALPLNEAEGFVRDLERSAKETPSGGNVIENSAMRFFTSRGYSGAAAAGIVGNLVHESGLNPNARAVGDGADGSDSIGVGQHNGERGRALRQFAAERGQNWNDLQTQFEFIDHELNSSESAVGARLKAARTPEEAAAAFVGFERPKGWSAENPAGALGWSDRLAHTRRLAQGGVGAADANVIDDARAAISAKRSLVAQDPLLAAARSGIIPRVTPLDPNAAPDQLAGQLAERVAQADAVAGAYQRAPLYLRPDEKAAVKGIMDQGGDRALGLIDSVIAGARGRAPHVLAEIGGDAPELAHAGMITLSTGDKSFARQVAEAIKARAVTGGKPPAAAAEDVATKMRDIVGTALSGMDAAEYGRTTAAASAWAQQEFQRRGMDPKGAKSDEVIDEAVKRARGMTGVKGASFGGISEVPFGGGLWRDSAKVQVPADVKTDRFGDALNAVTNDDLKGLANPPMTNAGRMLSADELRRLQPIFGPGGYRFGSLDPVTKVMRPVIGKDGTAFVLPWADLAPALRARVPSAFR